MGAPILGDRVFLDFDAKVVGLLRVGDDAAIGVNALPQSVMISEKGSGAYVNREA